MRTVKHKLLSTICHVKLNNVASWHHLVVKVLFTVICFAFRPVFLANRLQTIFSRFTIGLSKSKRSLICSIYRINDKIQTTMSKSTTFLIVSRTFVFRTIIAFCARFLKDRPGVFGKTKVQRALTRL